MELKSEPRAAALVGRIIECNPNEMTCLLGDFLGASLPSTPKVPCVAHKKREDEKEQKEMSNSSNNQTRTTTDSI